ncbi:hypothetical protein ACJJTC_002415 [Scirpophaga incertulas]
MSQNLSQRTILHNATQKEKREVARLQRAERRRLGVQLVDTVDRIREEGPIPPQVDLPQLSPAAALIHDALSGPPAGEGEPDASIPGPRDVRDDVLSRQEHALPQDAEPQTRRYFDGDVRDFYASVVVELASGEAGPLLGGGDGRGLALGAFGATIGGSFANRIAQNDFSPTMAGQVDAGPSTADTESTRRVEDKEVTYRRRLSQMDKTQPTAPAMVLEKRSRGTLLQSAATLAKKIAGRRDKGRSLIGFFASGVRPIHNGSGQGPADPNHGGRVGPRDW